MTEDDRPLRLFLVAGETSGDVLGAGLMREIAARLSGRVRFEGVGGPRMEAEGLVSLFPMSDIAVMGIGPVLARLPTILARLRATRRAALAARPDALVLIDSPDFTHRIGRAVRGADPSIATVAYVSPTVWAWRPGRAAKMAHWCDRLMALLPFEAEAHRLLGGPPTTYVGHPLLDRLGELRGAPRGAPLDEGRRPRVLVLPGSRHSEVSRLLPVFGPALGRLAGLVGGVEAVLPVVEHVRGAVEAAVAGWPVKPLLVAGEAEKFAAFRGADVALAASGTVTLELALAGVPTVAAYKLDWIARRIAPHIGVPKALGSLIHVRSPILPNIVADELAVPCLLDDEATPDALAAALAALLSEGPARLRQLSAFDTVDRRMRLAGGASPSARAAETVLAAIDEHGD